MSSDNTEDEEWSSGVGGAQCERCDRTTIVRAVTPPMADDPLDEDREWVCRPCFYGLDDVEFERVGGRVS